MCSLVNTACNNVRALSLGLCNSSTTPGRIECGWPNITQEQCWLRDCCYENNVTDGVPYCFVKPHLGKLAVIPKLSTIAVR